MTEQQPSFDAAKYKTAQREQWNKDGAAWRRWNPTLDRWYGEVTRQMLDLALIQPGQRILDVAAGAGEPAVSAAERVGPGGYVLATDISEGIVELALQVARERGLKQVETRAMDGEKLDLPDASFDAVLCRLGLSCHIPQQLPNVEVHMPEQSIPIAVIATDVPPRVKPTVYPEPFASRMSGREKRALGDLFGLHNFGVNLTRLAPGAVSSLRHAHTKQDEFVYILKGHPTLHTDEGKMRLSPGMCAGFKASTGNGHCLLNATSDEVVYLEVGDRTSGDEGTYPDDDLKAFHSEGKWQFQHKDGQPY